MNLQASAKREIERCAFKLFLEQGSVASSYTSIADASGYSRPLVQYHFPRKSDLILAFIELCTDSIEKAFRTSPYITSESRVNAFRITQLYYRFFLSASGRLQFLLDVLSDRNLTNEMMHLNTEWGLPFVTDNPEAPNRRTASLIAIGGYFDLVYSNISNGDTVSPDEIALSSFATYTVLTQRAYFDDAILDLRTLLIPEEDAVPLIEKIEQLVRM